MSGQVRMTEGGIAGHIIRFAVPLFLGNLFQQLYNLGDSLIIGNLIGNDALAAVSATENLTHLMIGFFQGIFMGAGVVIARFFGAQDRENMRKAIHTTMIFAVCAGVLISLAGLFLTPFLLRIISTPADIFHQTLAYIRTYLSGAIFLVLYNACMGIMQAVGDSKHPLYYLIFSAAMNILMDTIFIVIFKGGVTSAALATVIAQFLSVVLCLKRLLTVQEDYQIKLNELKLDRNMLGLVIRYGLPSGMQNSIIGFANVVVQSNVNSFGTMAVSGCGAYSKIEGFAFLPVTSFTSALTTFVGQNLGAKEYDRARRGSRFGIICSMTIAEVIGVILFFMGPTFVAAFTREAEAIAYGVGKMKVDSLFYFFLASSHCFAAVMRGAGKAKVPMLTMLGCWCIIRVGVLTAAVRLTHSIYAVYWIYPLTWALSFCVLLTYYIKADWVHGLEATHAH